jgi:uncharacterized protein (TIGR00304 family)
MVDLVFVGFAIILAGFLLVFLAVLLTTRTSTGEKGASVRGGGVVMIGPVPIIFGSDAKWTSVAIVLAIVLIVVVLLSGTLIGR